MIRCKFKCTEKYEREGWGPNGPRKLYGFKFSPVSGGTEENEKFFAATPAGSFEVGTVILDAFEVGKEYYLDISEA